MGRADTGVYPYLNLCPSPGLRFSLGTVLRRQLSSVLALATTSGALDVARRYGAERARRAFLILSIAFSLLAVRRTLVFAIPTAPEGAPYSCHTSVPCLPAGHSRGGGKKPSEAGVECRVQAGGWPSPPRPPFDFAIVLG